MSEIRVKAQDFTIVGAHSPQGQTFSARVYGPLVEALQSPVLFASVGAGLQVLDTIRLSRTDPGRLNSVSGNRVYETVELMVIGFDDKKPVVRKLSPIFDLQANDEFVGTTDEQHLGLRREPLSLTPQAAQEIFEGTKARNTLTIHEEETGQGRGKPKLVTFHVKDGLGNIIESFKDREAAEAFIAGGKRAA